MHSRWNLCFDKRWRSHVSDSLLQADVTVTAYQMMQLLYVFGVSHNDNQSSYYDQLTEVAEIFFYPTVAILLDEGLDQTEWRFYEVETSGDSAN